MRWVLLASVLAFGCGKAKEEGKTADPPEPPKPAPEPDTAPWADFTTLSADYLADAAAADAKYKGKRGFVGKVRVDREGRNKDDLFFIAMKQTTTPLEEPAFFFYFDKAGEESAKSLRFGVTTRLEGVCTGRKEDGIKRNPQNTGWRIEFTRCRVVTIDEMLKKEGLDK